MSMVQPLNNVINYLNKTDILSFSYLNWISNPQQQEKYIVNLYQ